MFTIKSQFENPDSYSLHSGHQIFVQVCEERNIAIISIWPDIGDDPYDIHIDKNAIAYVMNDAGQTIDIVRAPNYNR